MTPHRLHWLSAAVLVPAVLLVVLLAPGRAISAGDPAAATVSPPAAPSHGATPAVQSSWPFSSVFDIATSSVLTDVMAIATVTPDQGVSFDFLWSIDGGRTWLPFPTLPHGWIPFPDLAVVPRGDSRQPVRFILGDGRHLYRSGDFGMTWALSFTVPTIYCQLEQVQSGAMPQVLYVEQICDDSEPPTLRAGSAALQSTFYTSEDGGVTWRALGVTNLSHLTPSPTVPNRLYAGDLTGFLNYRSDDNGQTWHQFNTLRRDFVVLDAVDPDRQYAIADTNFYVPSTQVLQVSFDSGVTWQNWASSPCLVYPSFLSFSGAHPLVSTGVGELWARCAWTDDWYYSGDSGDTWRWKASSDTKVLAADFAHPGSAFMANSQGLWRSDHGGSWQLLTSTFQRPPPNALLYMPLLRH